MKINTNNTEAINTAIAEVEGLATARTITATDIQDAVEYIEKGLTGLMPKNKWQKLRFAVDPNAQSFPAAYKYTPESTQFVLERGSKDWFVVKIERDRCQGPTMQYRPLNFHDRMLAIVEFVTRNF